MSWSNGGGTVGAKFGDESWDFPDGYLISDRSIPILRNDKMQLEILRQ